MTPALKTYIEVWLNKAENDIISAQVLEYRKQLEENKKTGITQFDKQLKGLLNVPPPKKGK